MIGFEKRVFELKDLHQMEPLAVSVAGEQGRPILLLRSVVNQQILPVGISPLEAGVTLGQSPGSRLQTSPHHLLQFVLTSFGAQIEKAVFCEIKGPHQYLELFFKNHPTLTTKKFRADEVMSSCLFLHVPILAPAEFMEQSRVLTADLETLQQGLLRKSDMVKPNHFFMM